MQPNCFNFTIDDYEKSTKEFEKYVNAIPKKVPLKLTKSTTVPTLLKDFLQKSQFTDTEELCILSNILNTLQTWTDPKKPALNSEKLISLALRHDELERQHLEIIAKTESISAQIEAATAETNGFASVSEVEEVVELLKSKLSKSDKLKDQEKVLLQIQELQDLLPLVVKIEKFVEKLEVLEREKQIILQYIEQTSKQYEDLVKKV